MPTVFNGKIRYMEVNIPYMDAMGHTTGWCSTLTLLLICSACSRENDRPLLICSSRYTQPKQNTIPWNTLNNYKMCASLKLIYVCFNIEDRLSLKTLLKVCLSKWPPVKLPPRVSFLTRGIHMNQMLNALICRNLSIFQIAISGVIGSPTAWGSELWNCNCCGSFLVGEFNPIQKFARQIESFPQRSGWK